MTNGNVAEGALQSNKRQWGRVEIQICGNNFASNRTAAFETAKSFSRFRTHILEGSISMWKKTHHAKYTIQVQAVLNQHLNCSSLPAGLGGNGKFEGKFDEIWGNLSGNNSE